MNEIRIPFTITFRLQDTYICVNVQVIKKDDQPIVFVKLEPLFN